MSLKTLRLDMGMDISGSTGSLNKNGAKILDVERASAAYLCRVFTPHRMYEWAERAKKVTDFRNAQPCGGTYPSNLIRELEKSQFLVMWTDGRITSDMEMKQFVSGMKTLGNIPFIVVLALHSTNVTMQKMQKTVDASISYGFLTASDHVLILATCDGKNHHILMAQGCFYPLIPMETRIHEIGDETIVESLTLLDLFKLAAIPAPSPSTDPDLITLGETPYSIAQLYESAWEDWTPEHGMSMLRHLGGLSALARLDHAILRRKVLALQKHTLAQRQNKVGLKELEMLKQRIYALRKEELGTEIHHRLAQDYQAQRALNRNLTHSPYLAEMGRFLGTLDSYNPKSFTANRAANAKTMIAPSTTSKKCLSIQCPKLLCDAPVALPLTTTDFGELGKIFTTDFALNFPWGVGASTPLFKPEISTLEEGFVLYEDPEDLLFELCQKFGGGKRLPHLLPLFLAAFATQVEPTPVLRSYFASLLTKSLVKFSVTHELIPASRVVQYMLNDDNYHECLRDRPQEIPALTSIADWAGIPYTHAKIYGLKDALGAFQTVFAVFSDHRKTPHDLMSFVGAQDAEGIFRFADQPLHTLVAMILLDPAHRACANKRFQDALDSILKCKEAYQSQVQVEAFHNVYFGLPCDVKAAIAFIPAEPKPNVHYPEVEPVIKDPLTCCYCHCTYESGQELRAHLREMFHGQLFNGPKTIAHVLASTSDRSPANVLAEVKKRLLRHHGLLCGFLYTQDTHRVLQQFIARALALGQ